VAADDGYQVPAGTALSGAVRATDPDGDPLTFSLVSGPTLGRLESFDATSGAFLYVSAEPGMDSFSFRASDGRVSSGTGRITLTVTASPGTVDALAATAHGPVVLAGEGLARLDASGPVVLARGVRRLAPGGKATRSDGRPACLDPWSGSLREGPCRPTPAVSPPPGQPLAVAADPFAAGRALAVVAGAGGVAVLETKSGGGEWAELTRGSGTAETAALHFDLLRPGTAWLALSAEGVTRILAAEQDGREWQPVAEIPGEARGLAGLADPRGVMIFRGPEPGLAMVVARRGDETR
jgi:hypothetical protein